MVIDGDMDELPAGAAGLCAAPVRLAGSIAGDAVSGALETAEPLDVQMQKLAGAGALVAPFRLCGFEVFEARQAGAFEDAADGGGRDAEAARNVLACEAFAAQGMICSRTCCGVGWRRRCGRDERSARPAGPSASKRSRHLRAVRGLTPAARAAACGVSPLRIMSTRRCRPCRVSLAFLWTFIRSLRRGLKLGNSSLLGWARMDNLWKNHS